MENKLTFDTLPEAVSTLQESVWEIRRLILQLDRKQQQEQPEELLTIKQAADLMSLAVPTLYAKVSKDEIPYMKKGKRLYFSRKALLDYVREGERIVIK